MTANRLLGLGLVIILLLTASMATASFGTATPSRAGADALLAPTLFSHPALSLAASGGLHEAGDDGFVLGLRPRPPPTGASFEAFATSVELRPQDRVKEIFRPLDLASAGWRLSLELRWGCSDCSPRSTLGLFQGAWTDPVTGLAYHRNRWYDPRTASWLSEDAYGDVDSQNLYAFVGWRPHMGRDPMGTLCTDGVFSFSGLKRCAQDLAWVATDKEGWKSTGHGLWNAASLGTLGRVERQQNLGTWGGAGESVFQGARSISNAASLGFQEAIYETQMGERGPGFQSVMWGVSRGAYDLLPMEETRALIQEGEYLSTNEKVRLAFTGISKTAGALAGAKAFGEVGAVKYYELRITRRYRQYVEEFQAQGHTPTRVGSLADDALKVWAEENLGGRGGFQQRFDPQTARRYQGRREGANPDVLLDQYGAGFELKLTWEAAGSYRSTQQFGKMVDLFPEFNIRYVLGNGGSWNSTGTGRAATAYPEAAAGTAPASGSSQESR